MATNLGLLKLERDSVVHGAQGTYKPFFLSLRDSSEFADVHSFGFHKVPLIGVYGNEYSICSAIVLLSLPAVPRSLAALPEKVLSELKLNEVIPNRVRQSPNSYVEFRNFFSNYVPYERNNTNIRIVVKGLIKMVLEAACRRFEIERSSLENKKAAIGGLGMWRSNDVQDHMEIWNETTTTTRDAMEVENSEKKWSKKGGKVVSFELKTSKFYSPPPSMQVYNAEEEEKRIVAKRLVLKCIRHACNIVASHEPRGSIENLISSIKRMRINSPSPPPPPTDEMAKGRLNSKSPLPDRCLTPETLRMQKLRKKRGRSESHEVTSLIDYETMRKLAVQESEGNSLSGGILEEDESDDSLNFLADELSGMKIDKVVVGSEEEENPSTTRRSVKFVEVATTKEVTFSFGQTQPTSPLFPQASNHHGYSSLLHGNSPLLNKDRVNNGPIHRITNPLQHYEDARVNANIGSIPDMDFYVIIHSSPPPGICQKFLCSNTNEVNLVYHCWLLADAPCDPSVTISRQLEMGVYDPCNVQPVHLNLMDGGVPFQHLEPRTVSIHSCCFSPENAQLMLQYCPMNGFHSFFSVARSTEGSGKRVIALNIIPSSFSIEQEVRKSVQECINLNQLLTMLNATYPEIGQKVLSLVTPL